MTDLSIAYPALHTAANRLSDGSQRQYLWQLRLEYALLITCAAMSINSPNESSYYYIYSFVFCSALATFLLRFVSKPEQSWYRGRALAESVKTSVWKFAMRATPFDEISDSKAVAEFRNLMRGIIETNRFIGDRLPPDEAAEAQVTSSMLSCRQLTLDERKVLYDRDRIRDQRSWYAKKAKHNKNAALGWAVACALAYVLAIISSLTRAAHPDWNFLPTEPLITIASSIVGWMQIKKFNELTSAYTLTAHEIGFLQASLADADTDEKFSEFVNEAELAFSREHTQWLARASA